jgi:RNA polymerase sigma-70 factor (ECF subfamily)
MGEDWSKYSDAELWEFIKCNRSQAFDEICHRYWSKLYHAAYKVLQDHEASSDIIQEVLADLWMKRKDALISSLPAYLHGMVRNQVFNSLRNHKISQRHLDRMNHVVFVEQTEQMVNFNQLQEIYDKSVNALPERCREVFKLSRHEDLSIKEIAQRLDISPKTVENQMTKALKYLRLALKETVLLALLFLS